MIFLHISSGHLPKIHIYELELAFQAHVIRLVVWLKHVKCSSSSCRSQDDQTPADEIRH